MNIFGKILITTLPLAFFFLFTSVGTAYYFSRQALHELAETWLKTRLAEASEIAAGQDRLLRTYGLEDVPASIAKAKLDAGTLMNAIDVGRSGFIMAVDADGRVAVHPAAGTIGADVRQAPWFRDIRQPSGSVAYSSDQGRHLAMYDTYTPWGWTILAVAPESEVYGVANRMKPYVFYLGLFCAGAMSLALMLLTRRLTTPLRSLTQGAEQIGNGNLDTRIDVRAHDEIGRLGIVFNRMAAQLKETLTTLKHREERFRSLIENASDIVTILDGDGIITYQSPSVERILGYRQDELLGRAALDYIHPEDAEPFSAAFSSLADTPERWGVIETRIRHKDGSWRTIKATCKNLLEQPAVAGIVVNSRDVTKRREAEATLKEYHEALEKRVAERTAELLSVNTQLRGEIEERINAEEALRANQQRMRAILKASPVGIALVIDRRLDWANDTFYRMVGYDAGALLGQDTEILYPDYAEYERIGRLVYATGPRNELVELETRWVRADGSVFDCYLRCAALSGKGGDDRFIIAVSDVSESKRLEQELQRAKKMEAVGTLAGGVAHDLNNILSGIVSYPELLLLELPEDSPMRKPITTIQKSGERAAAIVQDLLTMARRGVAVIDVIDVNRIIADQLKSPEFDQLMAFNPLVSLDVHLAPEMARVKGSVAHLSKCFMNLLSNAAEAMPSGGTITIETNDVALEENQSGRLRMPPGKYVAVAISDNGVGISDEDKERIFEPFYTRKRMGRSGSGLGMAVVWGTMKDHNGHIDIDSEEGRGTTFTLYFPAAEGQFARSGRPRDRKLYQGRGERILVVDDSEVQREIAKRILETLGYRVASVASGEDALSYLGGHDADLIVLDMIMPQGMDGLDTYRRILETTPSQKAIIASGYSESSRVRAAQQLGAGRYIRKPYSIETIGVAVREALDADREIVGADPA